MAFSDGLLLFNTLLGLAIFANCVIYACKSKGSYRWFKLLRGVIALYIAFIYAVMAIGNYQSPVSFTAIYVRPAVTLLMVTLVIGAIYDLRKWRK